MQINKFKCGALALGLSCTHMHTDITSATMLFKAWSEVHRRQPRSLLPIFHLPPPSATTPSSHPHSSSTPPTKMATVTMKFSASAVDKLLSQLHLPAASPFDVLTALFWSRIAQQQLIATTHKRSISICVDFRDHGRNPPVPFAYFGNALHFSTLTVDADELLTGSLGQVSGYIQRHVAGMRNVEFTPVMCLPEEENAVGAMYGTRLTFFNGDHMIEAESGRALMYEAEFKKGEPPLHVSYRVGNVEGEGLILVMPSADGGGSGRTVTATLPEEQVMELCKDQEILSLEPISVPCGRRVK